MEFKDKIKNRMQALQINNEDLAKRMGVSPSTISRYLTGEIQNVRRDKIKRLADALEVDIAYLMDWDERDDYLGDYQENVEHLKDNPELLHLYNGIIENDNLKLLFDKAKTLSPDDLEKVLVIINTFIKEEDY
ncbi:MAG: helix-turn-helix domain-containing protein [Coprobacillaceae bacterium]